LRNCKPIPVWIYGSQGSGKTVTARYILNRLENETNIVGAYIDCSQSGTLHSILTACLYKLGLPIEVQNTSFKLERLRNLLETKPFILVLDELDKILLNERQAILQSLFQLPKFGLICISYTREALISLKQKLYERFTPTLVEFKPYTVSDLLYILTERAKHALVPNTYSQKILEKIAELADGNARLAIRTLRNAALLAERDSREVKEKHVMKVWENVKKLEVLSLLYRLTEDHRIIYEIIKRGRKILSGDLWENYLNACKKRKMKPLSKRRFQDYANKLKAEGLIEIEKAKLRGNIRVYKIKAFNFI
jgi:Cdc6-like AAA superfamily ATPase